MKFQRSNIFRVIFIGSLFLVLGLVFQSPAFALTAPTTLSIEPLTWNVIGLDSNDVTSGPNNFPIGARVCNTGATIAENVKSSFVWTTSDSYIDFRPGTLSAYTDDGIMLDPGACTDFYYEVEVERNSNAYEHSRQYVIQTSADGGEFASTPDNRELYVEYLISQSRNSVNDVQLDGVSIAPGGTMALMVGQTYTIKLVGSTATNGYNQLESFINFPNTIFQILSVESTYSVSSLGSPIDVLYADSCGWENDLTDPNYMSCVGSDGKSGGSVSTTYVVKILQSGSGAAETLNTLLYDFSGSSFHYNADFSVSARYVEIIDPNSVDIAKNFSPDPTNVGGTSKLTFTLSNPNPVTVEGASFSDTFPTTPGAMVVADPAGISTAGCGTPTVTAVPGAGSISVSGATIAPNSNCTISLNVSVPAVGTYENTSGSLKYYPGGEEIDTGNTATDTLEVNTSPPAPEPICGVILAAWDMENETAGSTTAPTPSVVGDGVSTATAAPGAGVSDFIEATTDLLGNPTQAWTAYGWTDAADDYLEFVIDTSNYTNVEMDFSISGKTPPGPDWFELFYLDEGTGTYQSITADNITKTWVPFQNIPITSSATGNTYVRIYATGASNGNSGSDMSLDDIIFHGCGTPSHLTITKSFAPDSIQVGATSTLTFEVNNPNNIEVTNVSFNDELPSGVVVASTPAVDMTGCGAPTFAPAAGGSTLSFSGGTIAALGTCTVSVDVTATTAGPHTNVSGFVSSTETGTNTDTDGYATDDLTALLPPSISKAFGSTPILVNGTSLLTFTITNPNQDEPLTGIDFTDNYPAGVVNANPLTPAVTNTCGGIVTAVAGAGTINLTGGNLAGGDSCTVTVTVTSATAGTYLNTSGNVSSTNGGIGNSASAELKVNLPNPGISMLKTVSTSPGGPWTKFVSVSPGDEIYYRFLVENIGDVALSPVTVNDPSLDTSGCTFTDPLPVGTTTIEPTSTCVLGPFSAAEGTNVNTATADGTYDGTVYTSDPSSATYVGASPSLSLLKEISLSDSGPWATSISGVTPAASVYYRFTITNTGNVPLETVSVTDLKVSTAACSFTQPLGVAESTNCVVGPVTAETVVGVYTNTATAHGTYKYDSNTYDSSPASASYTLDSPDLVITKTNDATDDTVAAGNAFNWTLTVTNQGTSAANFADGATLISDTLPAGATYGTPTADNFSGITNSGNINCGISSGVLTCTASGANVSVGVDGSFTVTFQVTTSTAGDLVNTATVDPNTVITESNESNNGGSDTVTVINASPAMTVVKSSATTSVTAADQVVPYSYKVTNTGDVTLTNVTLLDDNTTDTPVCSPDQPATLAPGAEMTCTASHTVTQAEMDAGGNLTNIATADSDQTEAVTDKLDIPISGSATMTVVKSSTTASVTAADQVVPYSYVVTNTGTVTLTNVTLLDDNTDADPVCSPDQPASLAPGAEMTCTANHTVTQDEINAGGNLTNIATADSNQTEAVTYKLEIPISGTASMTVVKSSATASVTAADQVVPYSYVVTNTGTVTLTNVTLLDDNTDDTPVCSPDQPAALAPTEKMTCTASHTVTQDEINTGGDLTNIATADSDQTEAVTDTLNIPISGSSSMTLVKSSTTDWVTAAGQLVPYSYVVTNTGTVTLTDVTLLDDNTDDTPVCSPGQPASLAPGAQMTCSASHTVTQAEINAGGNLTNVATATSDQAGPVQDTLNIPIHIASIGVAKRVVSVNELSVGTYQVVYEILVKNYSNVALNDLQVQDDLAAAFGTSSFTVDSVTSADFSVNNNFDGSTDIDLLTGTDSFGIALSGKITLTIQVVPTSGGPFENTAVASGITVSEIEVSDDSSDGTDPDNTADCESCVNGNGDPTDNTKPTPVTFGPNLFDPPFGIKSFDESGLPVLKWTMVWINDSNIAAVTAAVHDPIPAGTSFVASGASSGFAVPVGAPSDSTNVGVACVPDAASVSTVTTLCYYEGPTTTYPRGRVIWEGTLGPDLGATDAATAVNEIAITFNVSVEDGVFTVANAASIDIDLNGDGEIDPAEETVLASAQSTWNRAQATELPQTGFTPGQVTVLPPQPESKAYQALGDVWLEIPKLGVRTGIVGVPLSHGEWDVSWLSSLAGWLHGTAFPSFSGNSVLTGHVYLADGTPGPFINLSSLGWDDPIIVHAFGVQYVYHVRDVSLVTPDDLSLLGHEEYPWLTLITCRGYDEAGNSYAYRVGVQAVLVDTTPESYDARIQ